MKSRKKRERVIYCTQSLIPWISALQLRNSIRELRIERIIELKTNTQAIFIKTNIDIGK